MPILLAAGLALASCSSKEGSHPMLMQQESAPVKAGPAARVETATFALG